MEVAKKVVINDYEFFITFEASRTDGVVVNPKTARLDDPNYIAALKAAVGMYDLVLRYMHVEHYIPMTDAELKRFRELDELVGMVEEMLAQKQFEIPDTLRKFYQTLCKEVARREQSVTLAKRPRGGYVYLLRSASGYYKIGRTKNPADRLRSFSAQLPFEVEFACLIPSADMHLLEKQLHTKFEHCRVKGEWFNLNETDIEYLRGLAS